MKANEDLKVLATGSDRFFTVAIPTPSNQDDSEHRFEVEWRNARRELSHDWPDEDLAAVDAIVAELHPGGGAALVLIHGRGAATLAEFLDEPVAATTLSEGPLPRLAPVIEARQRVIAHVVVEADRAGADLTALDGGDLLASETVEGSTVHIHRGHPGGWSQRRFQQRAENTWEDNARDVADAVARLARRVDAKLIAVAGDVRAQTFILESLPTDMAGIAVKIDAGSAEGIADEVVRRLSTMAAEEVVAASDRVRAGIAHGTATVDTSEIVAALREGRVHTLLVHDDASAAPEDDPTGPDGARLVDWAIVSALATDAEIVVVPSLQMMEGPIAATLRW